MGLRLSLYIRGFVSGGVFVSMACWMVHRVCSGKRLVAAMYSRVITSGWAKSVAMSLDLLWISWSLCWRIVWMSLERSSV